LWKGILNKKKAAALQYQDRIVSCLPELRRFAGALVAPGCPHSSGPIDDLVVRAAALVCRENQTVHAGDAEVRLALYAAVLRLAQSRDYRPGPPLSPPPPPGSFADGLLSLQMQHRAALLLVTLERLSYEEAAAIIGVSRTFLAAKVSTARQLLTRRMEASGHQRAAHLKVVK
jgi:predicted DNA-binding protein (UPF0251 family)